jgi:hypothetical protein
MDNLGIAIAIWMVFVIGSYAVARAKGKSGFLWVVLAWSLGPIALLAAVLLPDKKTCSTCKMRVSRNLAFCPFCKKPVY